MFRHLKVNIMKSSRRGWPITSFLIIAVALCFFAISTDTSIGALRNLLWYRTARWFDGRTHIAPPDSTGGVGELRGCVRDARGVGVRDATVLVAAPDGTTFSGDSNELGCYSISKLPVGSYVPVASAPGQGDVAVRPWGFPVRVSVGATRSLDIALPPIDQPAVQPGRDFQIGASVTRTWNLPVPGAAVEREVRFDSGGRPNQLSLLYTPVTATAALPLIIAVYPGPADTWWPVSVPLAAAGYSVLAVGPAYALDLEPDVAELGRLVAFARAGQLPGADGRRMALLGGSYSSLHVMRLLQRDVGFRAAMLLGPPSDLFDMRRRFEEGSIFPPYGLDQALIALGTPDTNPEPYWRYSAVYHLHADLPPLLLMHSRQDEVIPFQQSELLDAALSRAHVQHEVYFFEGMKHYFLATEPSPELTRMYELTLTFLKRNMQ